jgi:hypothetical protein
MASSYQNTYLNSISARAVTASALICFLKEHRLVGLAVFCLQPVYIRLTFRSLTFEMGVRGNVVVKALCYEPKGRGFKTRRGELIVSIYLILPAAIDPGVYLASNKSYYQKQKNNVSEE